MGVRVQQVARLRGDPRRTPAPRREQKSIGAKTVRTVWCLRSVRLNFRVIQSKTDSTV